MSLTSLAKPGLDSFIRVLRGDPSFAELRTEIIAALHGFSYELRRSLDQGVTRILERDYRIALAQGIRDLADAAGVGPTVRQEELVEARRNFKKAQAAALNQAQVAVAEEYLMVCCLALDKPDLARTAYRLLRRSAFHGVLKACDDHGASRSKARGLVGPSPVPVDSRRKSDVQARESHKKRIQDEQSAIEEAAVAEYDLAITALQDAYFVADYFGDKSPELKRVEGGGRAGSSRLHRWAVSSPEMTTEISFEGLLINWNRWERLPDADGRRSRLRSYQPGEGWLWLLHRIGVYGPRSTEYYEVDVTVSVDAQAPMPVTLELVSDMRLIRTPAPDELPRRRSGATSTLPVEKGSATVLRAEFMPSSRTKEGRHTVHVVVGGVFAFEVPDLPPRPAVGDAGNRPLGLPGS